MSAASDLIERMEAETGQRVDDNDGDNLAMAGLVGAMSREMEQSPPTYHECDDVAAGLLIQRQMSLEHQQEEEKKQVMAVLLACGFPPDAFGKK